MPVRVELQLSAAASLESHHRRMRVPARIALGLPWSGVIGEWSWQLAGFYPYVQEQQAAPDA